MVENAEIVIHNSSFSSLDLNAGTKAQIIDCYIDAQFKPRPTLITANNSDISIQNCHFGSFINENGSTVLYGHSNSRVIIENSVFIQHNSSKGLLFLHNNSSMHISGSSISQNIASSPGYSSITLQDRIHADVHDTVFKNNSALDGGAMIAQDECRVTLKNCNFSSNKAIIGKTSHIFKNSKVRRAASTPNQNTMGLDTPISPTLFNQTSSGDKKRKVIAPRLLVKSSILKKISVQKEGVLFEPNPGHGGAIYVAIQSQLLVTNCTFEVNSAQTWGGAISADCNITLHVQETTFVGNKAQRGGAIAAGLNATLHIEETTFVGNKGLGDGGAIQIQQQSQLLVTNCVFDDNISGRLGSAIDAAFNVTLEVKATNFTWNRAAIGGAIDVALQVYLQMTNCLFDDNVSEVEGGAITVLQNSTLHIQQTTFVGNKAQYAGAICAEPNTTVHIEQTTFVGNKANGGGAIYAGPNTTVHIEQTTFVGNKALVDGEAIAVQQSYLRMTNCVFDNNISGRFGGAISAGCNATLEMQETNFTRNRAVQGGAIDIDQQSLLRITNCVFDNNVCGQNGGAICAVQNITLEMQETNFTRNRAASQGGAIDAVQQSYLRTTNCVFDNNVCGQNGGAICAAGNVTLDIQETSFTGNRAHYAGAVEVQQQSYLRITDCTFKDNSAKRDGGAIAGGFQVVLEINGSLFPNNSAQQGGAINAQQQTNLSITNCKFEHNFASELGGAILVYMSVKLKIQETNFTGNGAISGGALWVDWYVHCYVVRSVFNCNTVNGHGGAVFMMSKSSLHLENTHFTNNNATDGGAIFIDSISKLLTNMCSFWKNFGNRYGGAITLKGYSTAVIESCHFLLNYAVSGGAFNIDGPEHVSVHDTSLLRNVASVSGGAISISNGNDIIINNITCIGNQGLNQGGCLVIDSVTLTLNNSDISKNFVNELGAGVIASHSRIQVCLTNKIMDCQGLP